MTIPAPALSQDQNRNWLRNLRLTRRTACLLSLFGPALLIIPLLLVLMATRELKGSGASDVFGLIGMLLFVAAVVTVRFYFARWYARDKGRHPAWGIAGVFGFLGWVMLWCLADFNQPSTPEPMPTAAPLDAVQPSRVNLRFVLRALVLADVALLFAIGTAETILEDTLPEPVRAYAANQELPTVLVVAASILLLLVVVSWVGLWRLSRWAPLLYVVAWAGLLVAGPFAGPHISTGVGEAISSISSGVSGAILALVFLSPLREEFWPKSAG